MHAWTHLLRLFLAALTLGAFAQSEGSRSGAPEPEMLIGQFDLDGDGRISHVEAPERMQSRWEQIDSDGDGYVTLEELKNRDSRAGQRGRSSGPAQAGRRSSPPSPSGENVEPSGPFSVVTLGTGSPQYDPERSGPSTLIQCRGRYFLVDMGNGTQARLNEAGISWPKIDGLLFTHHHLDHNEEFVPIFLHVQLVGRSPEIVGPPGTKAYADFIKSRYAEDIAYRLQRQGKTISDFGKSAVREVKGGESFSLGPMKVKTARVNHTIHTVAYRFDLDGQSIVISGDLSYSDGLVELARGADVLVIDSGSSIARVGRGERAGGGERQGGGDSARAHATRQEVCDMARKAGVKKLVLTHIAPGEVDEQATRKSIGESFSGEVVIGRDLMEIRPGGATPPSAGAGGNPRVYVHAAPSSGARDGKAWATAFSSLQAAIDATAEGGEVWVAAGTYRPSDGTDRAASFRLRKNVALYGGFVGTETDRSRRDWKRHQTVLSGDIGKPGEASDNSYHVVTGADEAVLDGFTITGGNGTGGRRSGSGPPPAAGGGRPIHTSPEAVLSGAQPDFGGGMVNFQCAPTVRNCVFRDNQAGKGGAMYNMSARSFPPPRDGARTPAPKIESCTFINNHAAARGGAVANDLGTSPSFERCLFLNNSTDDKGGAIYNDFGCSPSIVNCLFDGNTAWQAGAVGNDGGSSPLIAWCTFTRNRADDAGGALYQGTGPANNPTVLACILWGNLCDNGPAEIYNWHDNHPFIARSCVQGGAPGEDNFSADPQWNDSFVPAAGSACASIGYSAIADLKKIPARAPDTAAPAPAGRGSRAKQEVVFAHPASPANPGDGRSWATAYRSLQKAVDHAAAAGAEVWAAEGVYQPDSADRAASFELRDGVTVLGGFAGNESKREQRNWSKNAAILDGKGRYHVLVGANGAVLDGFTITGGQADGPTYDGKGGGMINYPRAPQSGPMGRASGFSPIVRNCTFIRNRAIAGGAVYNYDRSAPQFSNCRFLENSADYGGAMVDCVGVRSILSDCVFEKNAARWRGGAIFFDYGARPKLDGCRFTQNRSGRHGGAVATISRASQLENTIVEMKNCVLAGNEAEGAGGAISNVDNSILALEACALTDNRAAGTGGAVFNAKRARAVLVECRLSGNKSVKGAAGADTASDESSSISRNRADWPDASAPQRPPGRP